MPQRLRSTRDIINVLTITVLFAVILCLVMFSARSYQHASDMQDENGNTRAVLAYITGCVRDSGSSDVSVQDRSGTTCLVIAGNDYEQKIYLHEDSLYEEYTEPGAGIDPDVALKIGTTSTFELELGEDGMLTVRTDSGSASVNTERRR